MNHRTRIFLFFLAIFVLSLFVLPHAASAQLQTLTDVCKVTNEKDAIHLNVGFSVPGVIFELPAGSGEFYVKNFGCYIGGFYRYFAGVAGILAAVLIMWGGYKYVTSFGNPSRLSDAKDTIQQALIGLAFVLGTYIILYTINPNLVILQTPQLPIIPSVELTKSYDWENVRFCREKAQFTTASCGGIFNAGKTDECRMVSNGCKNSNGICVAAKNSYAGLTRPADLKQGDIFINCQESILLSYTKPGESEEKERTLVGDPNVDCGYIKDDIGGLHLTGNRGVGMKCPADKYGCVIINDAGFVIYGAGDLQPGNGIIGAFLNATCY